MTPDLATRILKHLKDNHLGPSRAIPRDKLMGHFGMDPKDVTADREFRLWYSEMGIPTCNEGLYWPRGKEDRDAFEKYAWPHMNPRAFRERMAAFDRMFEHCRADQGEQLRLGI